MSDRTESPAKQASTDGARADTTASAVPSGSGTPIALSPDEFYMEGGFMVFTAAYHLRRGYCCNSSCRHCPYTDCAD
jgi:hypothetical protein